jgi:uncharacterized protein YlzI (FlbEa/FlbD family)
MITLNRLGHSDEPFQLNPDMIVTVESTPDTVVAETPAEVAGAAQAYRASVLAEALKRRRSSRQPGVTAAHRDLPWLSAVEDEST